MSSDQATHLFLIQKESYQPVSEKTEELSSPRKEEQYLHLTLSYSFTNAIYIVTNYIHIIYIGIIFKVNGLKSMWVENWLEIGFKSKWVKNGFFPIHLQIFTILRNGTSQILFEV